MILLSFRYIIMFMSIFYIIRFDLWQREYMFKNTLFDIAQ